MTNGTVVPTLAGSIRTESADAADGWGARGQEAVMRIPVSVRIVIGSTRMPVAKLLSLTRGSIIPLDRKVGDLVDIQVNDRTVARGEVVVLDGESDRFAVAIREVVAANEE
jgi:flagellar motor switch protein FliN/FliY